MEIEYWNNYYSSGADRSVTQVPSQFAAFVLGELSNRRQIIEFGCGFGRDSFFFSGFGFEVVGIDGAETAIAHCTERANGRPGIKFLNRDIRDANLCADIKKMMKPDVATMIYARFFLHAINDDDEAAFFDLAREICRPTDQLALEFRTDNDKTGVRETADHYRRYITTEQLIAKAELSGFRNVYSVEGRGFAKYKADDAHVARVILEKS